MASPKLLKLLIMMNIILNYCRLMNLGVKEELSANYKSYKEVRQWDINKAKKLWENNIVINVELTK